MDKNNTLALLLISVVVIVWMMYNSVNQKPVHKDKTETAQKLNDVLDSTAQGRGAAGQNALDTVLSSAQDSLNTFFKYGSIFSKYIDGQEKIITIETDHYTAKISSRGGALISWTLKDYLKWDKVPADLIWEKKGELYMTLLTMENRRIDTRDLYFKIENLDKDYIRLRGAGKASINFSLEVEPGKRIVKTFTFFGDNYIVDTDVKLENMETIVPRRGYSFNWSGGLRYQEFNSVDESSSAEAIAVLNGEEETLNADEDYKVESSLTGKVDYVAVKTKYFVAAIIPEPDGMFDGTIDMSGTHKAVKKKGMVERYTISIRNPYNGGNSSQKFRTYIGPLEYDYLKEYGLEKTINFGWAFIGWIGEFFILPLLVFVHKFIPNYGVTIIIFSILIKFMLYPLTIAQMRSSRKMKLLGPEMQKLRDKYKDDQKKQQRETMNLYSQYGINPAGGCLPLVFQMPILYALFTMFRTSIALRQADFGLWIHDLSMPDSIVHFGTSIMGMSSISGLALAMGVTMFIQQKLTITDPRQKAMVYMMPVLFTLMFSNFPAGLNLYYFMFNLLSIIQQVYINNFSKNRPTLESLKKAPKKEGWFQKKMREAQDIASSQGRSAPGSKNDREIDPNHRKKKPSQRKKKK